MSLVDIIEGVFNEPSNRSETRMFICQNCPFIIDKNNVVFGPRCGRCGCVLKWKVKSESKCPEGKW